MLTLQPQDAALDCHADSWQEALDQAAGRGTIHRNAAARRKSRLAGRLTVLKQKQGT